MTQIDWPRVSIVTPSYNQGQFLEQMILSVLNQEYPNLEFIIIDGGSTDDSGETIRKYEDRLAYWVSEPDRGMGHALNKGFSRATGDIVGWLNTDDLYESGTFEIVVNVLMSKANVHLVYGDYKLIDEQGQEIVTLRTSPYSYRRLVTGWGGTIPQPTMFFRRSILDTVGYIDENIPLGMDYEFYLRVGQRYEMYHISRVLGSFRVHGGSKSVMYTRSDWRQNRRARRRYCRGFTELLLADLYAWKCWLFDSLRIRLGIVSFRGVMGRIAGFAFRHSTGRSGGME